MFLPGLSLKRFGRYKKGFILFPWPELKNFAKKFSLKKLCTWLGFSFYINSTKDFIVAGPVLGAPSLVFLMKALQSLGIKEVLALGWAGTTAITYSLPEIFLPDRAICFEGIGKSISPENISMPDKDMLNRLKNLLKLNNIFYKEGLILSADFPYFFEDLAQKGFLKIEYPEVKAMDMETSALFSLGAAWGVKTCAIHFLVDRVGETFSSLPQKKLKALREWLFPVIEEFLLT